MNEEELRRLYERYVDARLRRAYEARKAKASATAQPGVARRVVGGAGTALGPLFRTIVGGMAAAGFPGQRPDRFTTAPHRFEEASNEVLAGEREFAEASPAAALLTGLAGAVPRYGLAATVPGGIPALAVAEAAASRPEESLAGLAKTGFEMAGMEGAAGTAERLSESLPGRIATDLIGGEAIALPFRGFRYLRNLGRNRQEQLGDEILAGMRERGPTQYDAPAGPGIAQPSAPIITDPRRMLPPADVRVTPETEPTRLLAQLAESLRGSRTSPFEPGAAQGPAIPAGMSPEATRLYPERTGPMLAEDPDATALRERLMQVLQSPPSETGFRNPETNRMAMMGGGAASRHTQDIPTLPAAGGEGRRMLVPKTNRPGEVVGDVQTRTNRLLADLLEGNYGGFGSVTPGMASPAFRANTPIKTIFDEVAAPLTPAPRQTPESRIAAQVEQEGIRRPVTPEPPAGQASPPTTRTTRLDPEQIPPVQGLLTARPWPTVPGARNMHWATGPNMQGRTTPRRVTGDVAEDILPSAEPMDLRRGVSEMGEEAPDVVSRRDRRSAMAQASNPELGFGEARGLSRGLRSGFTVPDLLEYVARGGVGAAAGGTVGAAAGQTPEERRRFALQGALLGAGAGVVSRPLARQSATNRRINESLQEVAGTASRRGNVASPTATPFRDTGNPPGIERQVIAGAPGVAKGSPKPQSAAGEVLSRPTTVRPKDEPLLRRLGLSPEMQDIVGPRVRQMSEEIAQTQKEPWSLLRDRAAKLLNVKRETLADIDPQKMTGPEGLALASLVRENSETLARLAKDYDAALQGGRTQEVERLAGLMNDLDNQTTSLLSTLMQGRSAQGRALQANRVLANLQSDPTYWIVKGQRIKGSEVLTAAERTRIVDLLQAGPSKTEDLLKYLGSLRRTGVLGQVAQMRRAGLLTGLTGRAYDFAGTGLNVFEGTGTRPLAAGIDRVASVLASIKAGGTAGERRSILAPTASEFSRMVRGSLDGVKRAGESLGVGSLRNPKQWSKFIREAEIDEATLARYDIPHNINITMFGTSKPGEAANAVADTYQKFVMRMSGATDKIWRGAAYNGALEEQARLVATREGLRGPAFRTRVQDLLKNPTEAMTANAVYESELLTFTNDGTVARMFGNAIEALASAAQKSRVPGLGAKSGELVRALGNLIVPFRRTPSNVLTRVLEHTPVLGWGITAKRAQNWWGDLALLAAAKKEGLGTAAEDAAAIASQRKMVQSLTSNVSGVGMMALGAWMYQKGILTGDSPKTPREAEQWRTEGRLPNAVLVGDQWVPVGRLAPFGTVLAVAANVAQEKAEETGSLADRAGSFTGSATRTVLDQPMLTGPREMLDALTGRDEWKRENFAENFTGSFVPSGIAAAARATGEQRMPSGMGEAIKMRTPWTKGSVPVRRNIFGEPLERSKGYLLPTQTDQRQRDPLVREMATVGARVGPLERVKGEDPKVYDWRSEGAGRAVRQALERTVQSERYRRATAEQRKELLEDAATTARRNFSAWAKRTYNIQSN